MKTFFLWRRNREEAHISEVNSLTSNNNFEIENDVIPRSLRESEEFTVDIEKILEESFEAGLECCIYRVPRDLRKINEKAYTPQVVSIGPLHHLKQEYLVEMEKQKLMYVKKFSERTSMDMLKELKSFIEENEPRIRICYAEKPNLPKDKFIRMILYDAIFVIELFLRNSDGKMRTEFDILLDTPIRKAAIKLDLQLLENQLPYFVFKEIFLKLGDVAKRPNPSGDENYDDPFLILAWQFFFDRMLSGHEYSTFVPKHFTDLRRFFLLKKESIPGGYTVKERLRDLPCATRLDGSGVKFNCIKDYSSLEISCEYKTEPARLLPFIKVKELELQIPCFEVYDGTECLIRNVMALEQLYYPFETSVCNFMILLDFLIDTETDVGLLVEKGIILDCLGDTAAIANMFNKLGLQVTPSNSKRNFDVAEKLKAHYDKSWNHSKANFSRVYFRDPWIGAGTVAAALILLLTLVQAVCSILQVL